MASNTAAEESGMAVIRGADERPRDLPCSKCHDEGIGLSKL